MQTYTQQMEANLRAGGQYGGSAAGCRLRQLLDEFSCIHSLKARGDPKGHRSLIATPLAYSGSAAAASHPPPDYQAAAVSPDACLTMPYLNRGFLFQSKQLCGEVTIRLYGRKCPLLWVSEMTRYAQLPPGYEYGSKVELLRLHWLFAEAESGVIALSLDSQ